MLNARLETETGHFVVTAILPSYKTLPTVVMWGERLFVLYEAGAEGYPSRYRERFSVAAVQTTDLDPCPRQEPAAG